jgi:hypothetical protein
MPKQIRYTMGLLPSRAINFAVNPSGQVVLH